ncbi:SDR family oxidoreductase [Nocardioides panacisoli]|uniref:SDR family oxidoreductase n=1 Tax=Nocardioides panacisoli TaxID=627624 RepID=UPI001C6349F5|nr:SDR family oxidoreductase [Nocardioides panacisoli]QYJ04999.1 SDR family oxidoreductase [Nocardioides panacisoli]
MDLGLHERVLVVTGGTRGLGRASAEALVGEGARVLVTGRDEEAVAATVTALEGIAAGPDAVGGLVADNADPETPARILAAARERWGRLDGALISVGGPPPGTPDRLTDEQWRTAFDSVFLGTVRLCRELGAELGAGGSLALVLSSSVRTPIAGLGASNGLRPGLAMLAKDLADEWGPRGIRVNGLLPGRLATDRVAQLDASSGDGEAARERWEQQIPLRRYGDPAEFGRAAAFLLSPAASFITGTMLPVDGGLLRSL